MCFSKIFKFWTASSIVPATSDSSSTPSSFICEIWHAGDGMEHNSNDESCVVMFKLAPNRGTLNDITGLLYLHISHYNASDVAVMEPWFRLDNGSNMVSSLADPWCHYQTHTTAKQVLHQLSSYRDPDTTVMMSCRTQQAVNDQCGWCLRQPVEANPVLAQMDSWACVNRLMGYQSIFPSATYRSSLLQLLLNSPYMSGE